MKNLALLIGILAIFLVGCGEPKPKENFISVQCDTVCDGNNCFQQCIGIKGKK